MVEEPVVPVMISQLVSKFKELVKKVTYDKTEIDSKLNGKASNTLVSSSANGLMSSVDKTKLDGIDEEANKTIVDSAMSSDSVNPVQNKIIHQELANKAPSSHIHSRLVPTDIPENADLNDYTTQGSFCCYPNTVSQTVTNTPYKQSFHLEVYKTANNGVCQVAYSFHSANVHTWWRNGYGGNWSEWYEVANKEDIASLNNNKANSNHTHNDNSGLIQLDCSYGNVWKFKKNGWVTVIWGNLNATSMATNSWVTLASTGWSNQASAHNYYGNFVQDDNDTVRVTVNPEGVLRCFKPSSTAKEITYGYIIYPTED